MHPHTTSNRTFVPYRRRRRETFGAIVTGLILSGFGGSFTDALGGQHLDLSMLFTGLIISLIASVFQYGCILQKQDDELL